MELADSRGPARCRRAGTSTPDVYARERERVFAREWLLFGRESQLPKPGDALAETIAGWPLFVVRAPRTARCAASTTCAATAPARSSGRAPSAAACCAASTTAGCTTRRRGSGVRPTSATRSTSTRPPSRSRRCASTSWRGFVFVNLDPRRAAPRARRWRPSPAAAAQVPDSSRATLRGAREPRARVQLEDLRRELPRGLPRPLPPPRAPPRDRREGLPRRGRRRLRAPLRAAAPERRREPVYEGFWAWLAPNVGAQRLRRGPERRAHACRPARRRCDRVPLLLPRPARRARPSARPRSRCARASPTRTGASARRCSATCAPACTSGPALAAPRERRVRLPGADPRGPRRGLTPARVLAGDAARAGSAPRLEGRRAFGKQRRLELEVVEHLRGHPRARRRRPPRAPSRRSAAPGRRGARRPPAWTRSGGRPCELRVRDGEARVARAARRCRRAQRDEERAVAEVEASRFAPCCRPSA